MLDRTFHALHTVPAAPLPHLREAVHHAVPRPLILLQLLILLVLQLLQGGGIARARRLYRRCQADCAVLRSRSRGGRAAGQGVQLPVCLLWVTASASNTGLPTPGCRPTTGDRLQCTHPPALGHSAAPAVPVSPPSCRNSDREQRRRLSLVQDTPDCAPPVPHQKLPSTYNLPTASLAHFWLPACLCFSSSTWLRSSAASSLGMVLLLLGGRAAATAPLSSAAAASSPPVEPPMNGRTLTACTWWRGAWQALRLPCGRGRGRQG